MYFIYLLGSVREVLLLHRSWNLIWSVTRSQKNSRVTSVISSSGKCSTYKIWLYYLQGHIILLTSSNYTTSKLQTNFLRFAYYLQGLLLLLVVRESITKQNMYVKFELYSSAHYATYKFDVYYLISIYFIHTTNGQYLIEFRLFFLFPDGLTSCACTWTTTRRRKLTFVTRAENSFMTKTRIKIIYFFTRAWKTGRFCVRIAVKCSSLIITSSFTRNTRANVNWSARRRGGRRGRKIINTRGEKWEKAERILVKTRFINVKTAARF